MTVLDEVRAANRRTARRLGYPPPPPDLALPAVDEWRSHPDVVDRALVVDVVVSCAHGFDVADAWTWLHAAGLIGRLTPAEVAFLDDLEAGLHLHDLAYRLRVEALWALLWSLSLAEVLDFSAGCGGAVAPLLPSFDDLDGLRSFHADAALRDHDDLVAALDLARCLTAGLGDADLSIGFAPGEVEPYVVWERRRALEWLAGADWDADPSNSGRSWPR